MALQSASSDQLSLVSYNLHGFNQGVPAIDEMINLYHPDVFLLQEHWLTPANLCKFDRFSEYFSFGCSAMCNIVESGMLVGRPFGGVITLVKNSLRNNTTTIYCSERFAIIKICNLIVINIYLPCVGSDNRLAICQDVFHQLWAWRDQYAEHEIIIAGDFNVDIDNNDIVANFVNSFLKAHSLVRCDHICKNAKVATYVNDSLGHQSYL